VVNQGLSGIDMTKFDFSSPDSWEKLGLAWQYTHGHAPNQEQLMAYVMSGGMIQLPVGASGDTAGFGNSSHQASQGRGRGRGAFNNRGGGREINVGYTKNEDRQMNSWEQRGGGGYYNDQTASDAIVLGGGDNTSADYSDYSQQYNPGLAHEQNVGFGDETEIVDANSKSNYGGKMQRVGDRWVWQPPS
jgi:protein NRD1